MEIGSIAAGIRTISHEVQPAADAVTHTGSPLRATLLYTMGQSLGGVRADEQIILAGFRRAGLQAEMIDLTHLSQAADGAFLLRNPATGAMEPWTNPHAALMYHGAIAPANAASMLDALDRAGTRVVNGRTPWEILTDKLRFAEYMEPRGVPVIPTELTTTPEQMRDAFARNGGRAVFKKPISTEGEDIFVVRSADQLEHAITKLPHADHRLIAQPMIDSQIGRNLEPGLRDAFERHLRPDLLSRLHDESAVLKHEFRVQTSRLPHGEIDIAAIYARVGTGDVNNIAQGAQGVRVNFGDLHPTDQQSIIAAARELPEGGDIVGWDLIGQPGQRRIIEGNSGSGLANVQEGYNPADVVSSYGTIMRGAAERSRLAG